MEIIFHNINDNKLNYKEVLKTLCSVYSLNQEELLTPIVSLVLINDIAEDFDEQLSLLESSTHPQKIKEDLEEDITIDMFNKSMKYFYDLLNINGRLDCTIESSIEPMPLDNFVKLF